ncbi:MAG: hypothetical protein M1549_01155 [Candidatus Dependentiae bacterium]|nr:hypothetical protein [Candidatus Dependentiae bacterium]
MLFSTSSELDRVRRIFIDDPVRVLGYDPDTDQIPLVESDTCVLCMHGFGDSKYSPNASSLQSPRVSWLPAENQKPLVTFNFRDHRDPSGLPLSRLRYTNLGGEPDARAVAFHIIKCFCDGYTNIVLFGHSRGCAATLRALDTFVHPYNYRLTWQALGFGRSHHALDCKAITAVRQAIGRIYLARPLLDIGNAFRMAGKRVMGSFFVPVTAALLRGVACTLGSCSMRAPEPIDLLKALLLAVPFDFYIFFAPDDEVVGNPHDALVMNVLAHEPSNKGMLHVARTGSSHFEFCDAAAAMGDYLLAL